MKFRSISSLFLVTALAIPFYEASRTPVFANGIKVAQVFRTNATIAAGETISTRLDNSETLYISNGERVNANLVVDQDVVSENGLVLIPQGAIIGGQFTPVAGGTKFVAKSLTSRGSTVIMGAESSLINDTKDPRETGVGAIAGDAAIGAAGGAILAGVLGDRVISTEKILGGAIASVLAGNISAPQVVVVDPNTSLNLTTNRRLTFRIQD